MEIAIIKYNAGNVQSVAFAFERLGINAKVTGDFDEIRKADKVIFPGVGEASTTMNYLRENKLDELIRSLKQPVLGVCLGMQLLCAHSEENNTDCIGIIPLRVKKFEPILKVPHMGWNNLRDTKGPLFDESIENKYVYFVHSYYVELGKYTVATADYINEYSAALQKDNFYATQFHPEKSGEVGAKILQNFIKNT